MDIHVLRNLVMRYGVELQLTSVEKECLWHLLDHDHNGKGYSYPSEKRIAARMGISERYVRSVIDRLARKYNLVSVIRRVGTSNQYRYHGIMKAMIPMLARETSKGRKRVEKSEKQLELLDGHRNSSSAPLRNSSSAPSGTPVPPNSANEHFKYNTSILTPPTGESLFDELLLFWNSLDIVVHTIAPRDEKGTFYEAVNRRLADGHSWESLRSAAQNYSDILHSDDHRFKYRWTITQFINRGFDQFFNREVAWENYKKSNFDKKGNSYADQQAQSIKRYRQAVAACEGEDR